MALHLACVIGHAEIVKSILPLLSSEDLQRPDDQVSCVVSALKFFKSHQIVIVLCGILCGIQCGVQYGIL